MGFTKWVSVGLVLVATQAMAFELKCLRDERPVDGDSVAVTLTFDGSEGPAAVTIQEDSGGREVEHHETTKLHGLTCKRRQSVFLDVQCSGLGQTLAVSDIEVAGGPGPNQPFAHIINVETTYKDKKFSFGGLQHSGVQNTCSWQ